MFNVSDRKVSKFWRSYVYTAQLVYSLSQNTSDWQYQLARASSGVARHYHLAMTKQNAFYKIKVLSELAPNMTKFCSNFTVFDIVVTRVFINFLFSGDVSSTYHKQRS